MSIPEINSLQECQQGKLIQIVMLKKEMNRQVNKLNKKIEQLKEQLRYLSIQNVELRINIKEITENSQILEDAVGRLSKHWLLEENEQKNILCGFFVFSTCVCYLYYAFF